MNNVGQGLPMTTKYSELLLWTYIPANY